MVTAIYLRVKIRDDEYSVHLDKAKTRVAPLKRLIIPRLELTAALILSRLVLYIQRSINLSIAPIYLWTDSSVTLT